MTCCGAVQDWGNLPRSKLAGEVAGCGSRSRSGLADALGWYCHQLSVSNHAGYIRDELEHQDHVDPRSSRSERIAGPSVGGLENRCHHRLRHSDGRPTTVPVHSGRDVPKGTLRAVLQDTGLTVDELLKYL